jgi:hypothetical protein
MWEAVVEGLLSEAAPGQKHETLPEKRGCGTGRCGSLPECKVAEFKLITTKKYF